MNLVLKVSFDNYEAWLTEFNNHSERAAVCDESKTTVGKVDDKNCIVMLYDVDMEGLQRLMASEHLMQLSQQMNIQNNKMHSFEALAVN